MSDTAYNASIGLDLKDGVTPILDKIDKRLADLENSFKKVEQAGTQAVEKTADSTKPLIGGLDGVTSALGSLSAGAVAMAGGAVAALSAVAAAVTAVLVASEKVVGEFETMQIRLATLYQKTESFSTAMKTGADTLHALETTSAMTGISVQELGNTFTIVGTVIGGTKQQILDITTDYAYAAKQLNTTSEAIANIIDRMLKSQGTGGLGRSPIAVQLQALYGISASDLKNWQEAGTLAEMLTAKLKPTQDQIDAVSNSWQVLTASLKTVEEAILVDLMAGALEPLKGIFIEIREVMLGEDFRNSVRELGNTFGVLAVAIKDVVVSATSLYSSLPGLGSALTVLTAPLKASITMWVLLLGALREVYVVIGALFHLFATGFSGEAFMQGLKDIYEAAKKTALEIKSIWVAPDTTVGMVSSHGLPGADRGPTDAQTDAWKKLAEATHLAMMEATSAKNVDGEVAVIKEKLRIKIESLTEAAKKDKASQEDLAKAVADATATSSAQITKVYEDAADKRQKIQDRYDKEILAALFRDQKAQEDYWNNIQAARTKDENSAANYLKVVTDLWAQNNSVLAKLQKDASNNAIANYQSEYEAAVTAAESAATREIAANQHLIDMLNAINGPLTAQQIADKQKAADAIVAITNAEAADKQHIYETFYGDTLQAQQKFAASEIATLTATGSTAADGFKLGMDKILLTVKSTMNIVSDFLTGVWQNLGQAFETGFYDVLTGKFDDLKSVFKSLWDDILKGFSKMLVSMLIQWAVTGNAMSQDQGGQGGQGGVPALIGSLLGATGQTAYNGGTLDMTTNHSGGGNVSGTGFDGGSGMMGAAGLVAGAYMFGSAVAKGLSSNQQPYTVAGQTYTGDFGGNAKFGDFVAPALIVAATSLVAGGTAIAIASTTLVAAGWTGWGLIAAALILLVGAIISIINGPKEAQFNLYTNQLGNGTAVGDAMAKNYGAYSGQISNINRAGGGSSTDFNSYMHGNNNEWMKQWQIKAHAGSGDDLTKDAEAFFKTIMPRLAIEQAFGQTFTGNYHGDTAGGSAGSEGIAGISGVPIFVSGSFDKDAPIPKMLEGLGLTSKAITAIAKEIDLRAPDEFLKWLGRIVDMMMGFKTLQANLSQSWQDIEKDMTANKVGGVTPALAAAQKNILDLAGEIKNYVGDDQLTKMEDLRKASDAYYASARAAIEALINQMHQVQAEADSFGKAIGDFLNASGKTPDWLASDHNHWMNSSAPDSYRGQVAALGADASPEDLKKIWDEFMADAAEQLRYLEGLYNSAKGQLEAMTALAAKFGTIWEDINKNFMDFNTINDEFGQVVKDWAKYAGMAEGAGKSAQGDLSVAASQQLYQHLQAFLSAVVNAQRGIDAGVAADTWQNNYAMAGNNDKSGSNSSQIGMIQQKIAADMGFIATATDPSEVSQYANEIRGLLHTYQGFFKPGSGGYNEAYTWSNTILAKIQSTATTTLGGLKKQGLDISGAMSSSGYVYQSAEEALQASMTANTASLVALRASVDAFAGVVNLKLGTWADQIAADMTLAGAALKKAMDEFTKALGGTDSTGTAPGPGHHGPDEKLNDLSDAVGRLTVKVNTLADKI